MLHASELSATEQIFTHIDDTVDPPRQMSFAVERIYAKCIEQGLQIFQVPITREDVAYTIKYRGIELERLNALSEADLVKPILMIRYPGTTTDEYLMIDGCHRFVRNGVEGKTHTFAYVIEDDAFWEPFLVDGVPPMTLESLLNRKSGL